MVILIKATQLLLSLSILVVLHEMGHFLPARWFKIRVEKFYLFFDPWFSLFKKKVGDTEYGIGWLPLGGYVKISGMVDESMDKEAMTKPAEPWEFRSKPAWQRLIVMIGGVTVNLFLGFLIYIGVLFFWGRDHLPLANVVEGIHPSATLAAAGVKDGDKILTVDGEAPKTLGDAQKRIVIHGARTLVVDRNGERVTLDLGEGFNEKAVASGEKEIMAVRIPFFVDSLEAGKNAAKSELRKGDRIVGVDHTSTLYFEDFRKNLQEKKGESIVATVIRSTDTLDIPVQVDDKGLIGVRPMGFKKLEERGYGFHMVHEDFSLLGSIPAGINYGLETLGGYVSSLKLLFTRSGAGQIGGFGAIGSMFPGTWDWEAFWTMTAFLSIVLAFMNILPIPALDGGHVVFLLYEMITRRTPNQRVLEVAQMAGMALLLVLVLYANGNDLFKWLSGQ